MQQLQHIQEIFFRHLSQYQFNEQELDYSKVQKHEQALQSIAALGNSGTGIFDLAKKAVVFYSNNFGNLLGYQQSDYEQKGQQFFAEKIHPDDTLTCSMNGVSILKLMSKFNSDEKLNHKLVSEYRMLNAEGKYVRLIEQYQVLELDDQGQIWLMMNIVDLSPNQDTSEGSKCKLLNFRTGRFMEMEEQAKLQFELTDRELEILQLVKEGLLSKEISDRLSISVHTVNTHRQRYLEKLGANNSMEAVVFASKFGLLN